MSQCFFLGSKTGVIISYLSLWNHLSTQVGKKGLLEQTKLRIVPKANAEPFSLLRFAIDLCIPEEECGC